jgi:hypothetical protein
MQQPNKNHSLSLNIFKFMLCALCLTGLSSCGTQTTDPEYKLAMSRVSNAEVPPQKVVGEWVSIIIAPWGEFKTSFKFLPNGSGLLRRVSRFTNGTSSVVEQDMAWTYTGANSWNVKLGVPRILSGNPTLSFRVREPFTLRSYQNNMLQSGGRVFVPMDNDSAVKTKLQQMRREAIAQGI